MNSRQRRTLRRAMERETDRQIPDPISPKVSERPMAWPMVLLCRASNVHAEAVLRRGCWPGGRRELHLFTVLNDHKFAVHGLRYDRRPYDRRNPWTEAKRIWGCTEPAQKEKADARAP